MTYKKCLICLSNNKTKTNSENKKISKKKKDITFEEILYINKNAYYVKPKN